MSLLALLGAAALACEVEPGYLGTLEPVEEQPPSVEPFSCNDLCFVDPSLTKDEARALYDVASFPTPPEEVPAPKWIYPLAESVHPSNLGLMTLHFERPSDDLEMFELSMIAMERSRKLYFPCLSSGGNGCTYKVPEDFWTNATAEFAGQKIELQLRGASVGSISQMASRNVEFSPDPVEGGLYYWSSVLRGMYRLLFGGRQAVPYVAPGTNANPEACAGCHAVSRDGATIAYTVGSADPDGDLFDNAAFDGSLKVAPIVALDQPSIDPESATPVRSGMMTLSTDGTRVVSGFDLKLELRDTQTGVLLDETDSLDGKRPFFPEFSPVGDRLVLTLTNNFDTEIAVWGGGIYVVSVAGDVFGEVTELVPEGNDESHYYPSWSPDGKWVAFVTSPEGVKSYDQPQGRLRLVSVDTGEVFDLAGATGPSNSTSTWPKFAPFHQCPGGTESCTDSRIFFLTYSSKRPYGLLANQPGEVSRSQLWMSALFMSRAQNGEDPSSPPFWLPYQDPDNSNHLPYWTSTLRCNEIYGCGPFETCTSDGNCILVPR